MSATERRIAELLSWCAIVTFIASACLFLAMNPWRHPQYYYVFNLMLVFLGVGIVVGVAGLAWPRQATSKRMLFVGLILNVAGLLSVFVSGMLSAIAR